MFKKLLSGRVGPALAVSAFALSLGLTAANEAASDDEEPQQKVAIASDSEKEGAMSREEALKMLQSVRDRDMLRRLRQEQLERSRRRPVDRDW